MFNLSTHNTLGSTVTEEKRSKSESEVASNDSFVTPAGTNTTVSASVTDLVKEIQSQVHNTHCATTSTQATILNHSSILYILVSLLYYKLDF